MHAVIDDSDPMRRDRRAPERRTAQVRIVRKADAPPEDHPMQTAMHPAFEQKLAVLERSKSARTEAHAKGVASKTGTQQ